MIATHVLARNKYLTLFYARAFLARRPRLRALALALAALTRSGLTLEATAPAAWAARRAFFLTAVFWVLIPFFLEPSVMATAPSCSTTPTLAPLLARPLYL